MNTAVWEKEAIDAATQGTWKKAIELNQKILKSEPRNIAALNRLARAFLETGNLTATKKAYQKVLKFDQYNPIALKNLKRLTGKNNQNSSLKRKKPVSTEAFLEEPRKTKMVQVVRLTSAQRLAEVDSGDEVMLAAKKRFVAVMNENNIHLGCLPEDISRRLITFISGGNRYRAFVKTVDRNHLEILIKETHRSKRFQNRPSF
ncbi:hypothetical protein COU96_03205 [Candidatus Shapirobacteria bacterium CG10_big_fil_rev_8_21_14_0_10_38_14]|uniref:Uncharacterized protein n=1 Tax=Candidatus Shapirobacteria bacterium CG10_big_fil_rev_8_21_14_0_10_38_14 TaxID=1974483 RepID=A0A2M8L4V2_9BACT|nr:MAG: hypothetical protein COU96_03205 [Candidatus Shapirobacteria bacterium CG10_big_fil_rev_8_21_14_0_10_38_14]